ncbi:MAG: type II toxin-antitoxin system RelE/ParE family toxin [Elusimicrobia bacterium]|nr:type II toxin-antitoxin system RelE/ParE family toxin [Elusimicrobiota bacterium]
MKFSIFVYPSAEKDLKNYSIPQQTEILKEINSVLSDNPLPKPPLIKKLKGIKIPLYRLRIKNLRVIYRIAKTEVVILRVINRKELELALKKFH